MLVSPCLLIACFLCWFSGPLVVHAKRANVQNFGAVPDQDSDKYHNRHISSPSPSMSPSSMVNSAIAAQVQKDSMASPPAGASMEESDSQGNSLSTHRIDDTSVVFLEHAGFISKGNNLLVKVMTVENAKSTCASLKGCMGFTHQGEHTTAAVKIWFKGKWDLHGKGWVSYQASSKPKEASIQDDVTHNQHSQSKKSISSKVPLDQIDEGRGLQTPETVKTVVAADAPEQMRFSVVRIQSIVQKVNWFKPYQAGQDEQSVGSGFAVHSQQGVASSDEKDPLFITNAHVVRNAHTVMIQLPTVGQEVFAAYVPLIYEDMDLAVVKLREPAKFLAYLASMKKSLSILKIQHVPIAMGQKVAAYGFPLGSMSLKLSEGIIAGTETINGNICYQSTAPISPGNSGGPLFAIGGAQQGEDREPKVVGVNFASSSDGSSQNVNFVVASIHIQQALHMLWSQEHPAQSTKGSTHADGLLRLPGLQLKSVTVGAEKQADVKPRPQKVPHLELKVAPIDVVGVQANAAMYSISQGCESGFYLAKIHDRSALRFAKPPVLEHSFITKVDDVPLDSFGMGITTDFLQDPLPFETIMALRPRIEDEVVVSVCQNGTVKEHKISMAWRPEYEHGIAAITEPWYHPEALDFEVFADLTVMEMSVNHIVQLLEIPHGSEVFGAWLTPEKLLERRLMVTDVRTGTYASQVLSPGSVIDTLNGVKVGTLKEFRKNFLPANESNGVWTLSTDKGVLYSVGFQEAMITQLNMAMSRSLQYVLTPFIEYAAQYMHLLRPPPSQKAGKNAEKSPTVISLEDLLAGLQQEGATNAKGEGNKERSAAANREIPQERSFEYTGNALSSQESFGDLNVPRFEGSRLSPSIGGREFQMQTDMGLAADTSQVQEDGWRLQKPSLNQFERGRHFHGGNLDFDPGLSRSSQQPIVAITGRRLSLGRFANL